MSITYIAKEVKANHTNKYEPTTVQHRDFCFVNGSSAWQYRAFVQHDFSGIPIGSKIISAKLYVYAFDGNDNYTIGGCKFDMVLSEWEEDSITWDTEPDIANTPIPEQWIVPTMDTWNSWDITEIVQRWISHGYPNNGIQFINMNEDTWRTNWSFYTRRYSEGEYATYIEVEYEPEKYWLISDGRMLELANEARRITNSEDKLTIKQIITALQSITVDTDVLFRRGTGAFVPFDVYAQANASVTIGTNAIAITGGDMASSNRSAFTTDWMDLSQYSCLIVKYKCSNECHEARIGVTAEKISAAGGATAGYTWGAYTVMTPDDVEREVAIDLTDVLGGYIAYNGGAIATITDMRLIPIADAGGSGGPFCVVSVAEDSANVVETAVTISAGVEIQLPSGVEYYYNHEQLPEIPADVVAKYPYLVIMRKSDRMRIIASTEKAYYHTMEDGSKRITVNSTGVVYRADVNTVAGGWVAVGIGNGTWFGVNGSGSYAVWWSNYDIPNGSADATDIYFPASLPQEEQPADATHFYYNGVRLPKIPDDVLTQYPYAWIRDNRTTGQYQLIMSQTGFYFVDSSLHDKNSVISKQYNITIGDASATAWVDANNTQYSGWGLDTNRTVLWSNHNIANGSADATDIYHYGTLAVPDPD